MSKRGLALILAICAVLALISAFALDRPLALAVHQSGIERAAWIVQGREFLDHFTGHGIAYGYGKFLAGGLFIAIGLVWSLARRGSRMGPGLAFAGLVQVATIIAGGLIKDLFGRMRPYQLIEHNDWSHVWFAGGDSFPSGHNSFFWGLFLPLAYAFPKYRIPLLIVPVFIAFARIDENYHFLSDVLAAIALAALMTLIAATLFGRWIRPTFGKRT